MGGRFPSGMQQYLEICGWHFSKKMCEWAVSMMKKRNTATGKDEAVEYVPKEQIDEFLKKNSVTIPAASGYDYVYVYHSAKADFYKSSLADEQHLALYMKDYFDDVDAYPTMAFTRFYADCIGKGIPIVWEDLY